MSFLLVLRIGYAERNAAYKLRRCGVQVPAMYGASHSDAEYKSRNLCLM
ncbi:TPA: hypothetical protein QDA96_002032 [Burkholderia vietnamiensis]|nr:MULTISPECIES: hypothetical protein [Burkholderia]MBR8012724.1 hypothetical protein [Burkholderia vietnamiensis]HDR8919215.1 hypothetical protein [Burkholderia vietnamiensis]HDR8977327.1 hypothetical protein [Burkholderia vietnamiensis]HDR9041371.1 hypothetical protein [Burkholderia vietnamiensis]HDR9198482.1 hypothetical protein [Burkholderia vietnamiensis]